jgi:cation diffusion facilitator CzcD-associated flavoprotein CzcO
VGLNDLVETVVVGAGPFGLAAAAHLRVADGALRVFGEPMGFWKHQMPAGMLLRSQWDASHIADPAGALTLDRYQEAIGRQLPVPVTLTDFIGYGEWFRQESGIEVDPRRVHLIGAESGGFRLQLAGGEELLARRVIVATGLADFPWWPPELRGLPRELASHSSEHDDFSSFAGRTVVVGAGQSAVESAVLLAEAGADVEVLARGDRIYWLVPGEFVGRHKRLHRLLYPPSDVGPPGLNWVVAVPALFRTLPRGLQGRVARRVLRPAAAGWLRPRLGAVRVSTRRRIAATSTRDDGRLELRLDDGSSRVVDHLLLGTGYRVEIGRLPILADELRSEFDGGPLVLGRGFESRVPGLHFVGAAAAYSFGPIMRFVAGTRYMGRELAAHVTAD